MLSAQAATVIEPAEKRGDAALVSVVIPAFNAASTIGDCLESLLGQTYRPLQIVVVDDGSEDETEAALRGFGDHIEVVAQVKGGLAAARGAGMMRARGRYIAWLDADDICLPESVEQRVAVLEARPDVVAVSTGFEAFDAKATRPDVHLESYYARIKEAEHGLASHYPDVDRIGLGGKTVDLRVGELYPSILSGNVIHPPTLMFRRSLLDRIGFPDRSLISPDQEYIVRIARAGDCALIPRPLLRYRLSPNQRSVVVNGRRLHVGVVQALKRSIANDPDLLATHSDLIEARLGNVYATSFAMLAEDDKKEALRCLLQALRHRRLPGWRDFTKFLLPASVAGMLRRRMAASQDEVGAEGQGHEIARKLS